MRVFAIIMNTDGKPDANGDIHPPHSASFPEYPEKVFVHRGSEAGLQQTVGHAYLEEMPGGLAIAADIDINDALMAEEVAEMMYPFTCGLILKRVCGVVESSEVKSIGLSFGPNIDTRIDTLGNQKRKARGES